MIAQATPVLPRSLTATVVVSGVPPNWSQWRGASIARSVAMKPWRDKASLSARSARARVHWPPTFKADPPVRRYLSVQIHKQRPLYDEDGAVSCLKPLIDGLQGEYGLVWNDGPDWLALITPPTELQHVAQSAAAERVLLTVHLVDPRPPSTHRKER